MPQQQQQQQSGGDGSSLDFLWMIVLIIGIVLAAWYFGRVYITQGIFYTKLAEIHIAEFFLGMWGKLLALINLPGPNLQHLNATIDFMHQHKGAVDFNSLVQISSEVGKYYRYPFAIILLLLAVVLYFRSVTLKYKSIFTMKRLKAQEKHNWPRIVPVANLDLVNTQLDKMPWAMAATPMQFCKRNGLLKVEVIDEKPVATVISSKAHDLFALQLGSLWKGPQALPKHALALLAIFAGRIDSDVDAADKLLDQIAASSAIGKLDFSGSERLLAKHMNFKPLVKVFNKHAYDYTIMAAALDLARGAGVLASADFIWLKPIDRKLWYILNCVGRQTAFAEIAGIFGHWLAEIKLGIPLMVPMVDQAVSGLEDALTQVLYEPEED